MQVPVTLEVLPPSPLAVTDLQTDIDGDTAAGARVLIAEVNHAETGNPLPGVTIASYDATLAYDGLLVNVQDVRLKAPFDVGNAVIDNPSGLTTFYATGPLGGAPWPIDPLAFLALRLTGSVLDQAQVTLGFTAITDQNGDPIVQEAQNVRIYKRGDSKADGIISVADVLFCAQYLAGVRGLGDAIDLVNAVNTASVNHDNGVDAITVADCLFQG